jgi:hypothetical protein
MTPRRLATAERPPIWWFAEALWRLWNVVARGWRLQTSVSPRPSRRRLRRRSRAVRSSEEGLSEGSIEAVRRSAAIWTVLFFVFTQKEGAPSRRSMCRFSYLGPQDRFPGWFIGLAHLLFRCPTMFVRSFSYVNQKNYFEKLFRLKLVQFKICSILNFMFKFEKYVQTQICSNLNLFKLEFVQIRICEFVQTWFCSDSNLFKLDFVQI